jgi:hypothetical protein
MNLVKIPTRKTLNFNFTPESELRGEQLRKFVLAGKALFTVLNQNTKHYNTFLIKKHKEQEVWYVYVLVRHNYVCIGQLDEFKNLEVKEDGILGITDERVEFFKWFISEFLTQQNKYENIKVYHHGNCGSCGKTLTKPDSIKSGIGPVCGKFKKNKQ